MRILLDSHSFFPEVDGVAVRYMAHARSLKELGHEVHLLTLEPELDADLLADVDGAWVLDKWEAVFYNIKTLPEMSPINFLRICRAFWRVRPDVVHVTQDTALPFFMVAAIIFNTPVVVAFHTDCMHALHKVGAPQWFIDIFNFVSSTSAAGSNALMAVTPSFRDKIQSQGYSLVETVWGPMVNPAIFHPGCRSAALREKLSFGHPGDFLLTYCGRIAPEKNVGFVVEAVRRLRAEGHRDVRLALVGAGAASEEFVPMHGEEESGVYFVEGFVAQSYIAQVYASACGAQRDLCGAGRGAAGEGGGAGERGGSVGRTCQREE